MICPYCNAETAAGATVCQVCGEALPPSEVSVIQDAPDQGATVIEIVDQRKPNLLRRPLSYIKSLRGTTKMILAAVTAAVILLCVLLAVVPSSDASQTVVYQKGNRLYYTTGSNYGKTKVMSDHIGTLQSGDVVVDEQGESAFYPYDDTGDSSGYILYYGGFGSLSTDGTQLATDVRRYETLLDYRGVYYLTGNGALYYSDLKKSAKIATSVLKFYCNKETGDLLWQTKQNAIYYKAFDKQPQLIAEQVNILYVSKDVSQTVYAGDGGVLYSKRMGYDPVLIGVGVSDVRVYSADSMYYLMQSDTVSAEVGSPQLYRLYYYDGRQSTMVTDNAKVIDSGLDREMMFARTGTSKENYQLSVVVKNQCFTLNLLYTQILDAVLDQTGERFYYVVGTEQSNTLYCATLDTANNMLRDAVAVDENVSVVRRVNYDFDTVTGSQCYYFKNTDQNGFGDLYIDRRKVAENVNTTTTVYSKDGGKNYVFCSDIYQDSGIGTLVTIEGEQIKVLGENVVSFTIVDGCDIAYISDANTETGEGNLNLYKDGGVYSVNDGVSAICYATQAEKSELEKNTEK